MVRLIRSKGVGIFFITQNPIDIPDTVLSQLGNRIQHALRAYSPSEQKAVKAAAQTFRPNPKFDTEQAVTECGTGEALISFLDEKGVPSMVERANILPPQSLMGPVDNNIMAQMIASSDMGAKYNAVIDRESAYEILSAKAEKSEIAENKAQEEKINRQQEETEAKMKAEAIKEAKAELREEKQREKRYNEIEKAAKSILTSAGRTAVNSLVRGLLGSLKK